MIFYVATNSEGHRTLYNTQAEARAWDKNFVQLDIPVDRAGLRDALQELLSLADAAYASNPLEAEIEPENPQVVLQGTDVTGMSHEERDEVFFTAKDALKFREMVESQWPHMPLAWRLDMAQKVMEECRKAIPWSSVGAKIHG